MEQQQPDNFYKGLFFGAALGAATGTLFALLFAPNKGTETQRIISGKVKHAIDKAADYCESSERESAYSNEAKKRSQEIIDTARDEAKKILNEANNIIKEIKRSTRPENT